MHWHSIKIRPLENLLPRCSYAIKVDPNTADRPLKIYFLLNKGTTYLNNNASDIVFLKIISSYSVLQGNCRVCKGNNKRRSLCLIWICSQKPKNQRKFWNLISDQCRVHPWNHSIWRKNNFENGPRKCLFPATWLCFCPAFTSYYEECDRGHTITAKKPTKSMNSHPKKTQEYIKGKSPLFIL